MPAYLTQHSDIQKRSCQDQQLVGGMLKEGPLTKDVKSDLSIPQFLKIPKEERKEAWVGRTMTEIKSGSARLIRTLTPESEAFRLQMEEEKKLKTKARIGKMLVKHNTPSTKTHYWETLRSRWVPIRHYKPESRMKPEFENMIGPDLVKVHNEMAVEAAKLGIEASVTKRFATRVAGIKRCEELYKAICEKQGTDYTPPAPSATTTSEPSTSTNEQETDVAKTKTAKKSSTKTKTTKTSTKTKTTKTSKPAKEKVAKADVNPVTASCGVRSGTNRERMLLCLHANLGYMVPLTTLLKATYKGGEEGSKGAFLTIARDLPNILQRAKAPFEMVSEKDEKGQMTYGLIKK